MLPIQTERSNFVFKGDGGEVVDLHVERATINGGPHDGMPVVYSVWEPTEEDRERIAAGGNIKVGVWLAPPPPIIVLVTEEQRKE